MYEKFSKLLQDYGVSAYKVSKETGISQSVFSEWKRGKSQPKLDKLRKIADFLMCLLPILLKTVMRVSRSKRTTSLSILMTKQEI